MDRMPPPLSSAEVDAFQRDGYHICPKLLDEEEVQRLRAHAMAVVAGEYETRRPPMNCNPSDPKDPTKPHPDLRLCAPMHQVNNCYWADATLARFVLDARIGYIAAALAQVDGVRLWHDQLLYKPPAADVATGKSDFVAVLAEDRPEDGSITFHQDYGYWQTISDERALTARIALFDENEENGCMQVLAGSHSWPEIFVAGRNVFSPPNPPLQKQFEQISQLAGGRAIHTQPLVVEAGGVTFHTSRLVHGSFPNSARKQGRLSLVVHMIVDGTVFRGFDQEGAGHSSNTLLMPEAAGEPYAGPYFPVIWSEGAYPGAVAQNTWAAPSSVPKPRL